MIKPFFRHSLGRFLCLFQPARDVMADEGSRRAEAECFAVQRQHHDADFSQMTSAPTVASICRKHRTTWRSSARGCSAGIPMRRRRQELVFRWASRSGCMTGIWSRSPFRHGSALDHNARAVASGDVRYLQRELHAFTLGKTLAALSTSP